jgi:hypothetical protein
MILISQQFYRTQPSGLRVHSELVELLRYFVLLRFSALIKQDVGEHAQYAFLALIIVLKLLTIPATVERVQEVHGVET